MGAVLLIAWGNFGFALAATTRVIGWVFFGIGALEYYVAAALYVGDLRAVARTGSEGAQGPPR